MCCLYRRRGAGIGSGFADCCGRKEYVLVVVVCATVWCFALNMESVKEDAYTVVIKEVILRVVDRSVVLVSVCVCG